MLRTIVVDDEELAIKRLKRLLAEHHEINEIETFYNPWAAYEYAKVHPVDIAFLDISMPDVNGVKLSVLLKELRPAMDIVFVTGTGDYAVKAYELSALDYVVKPVTTQRLETTMDKIRRIRRISPAKPSLRVRLFGGLSIATGGSEGQEAGIKLRSPKTEELFAFLVCKRSVSREEVAGTLWNGLELDKALKNLSSTLYYIRKAIDVGDGDSIIATAGNEIRLQVNAITCDLYEFERLLKEIRRDPERKSDLLERAEAIYAGPLLQGKSYDWAIEYAGRTELQYMELLEMSARYDRQRGQLTRALHGYGEMLKLDAMREDVYYEVIALLLELGRKREALQQYRVLEELLWRELGAEPDPRIRVMLREKSR